MRRIANLQWLWLSLLVFVLDRSSKVMISKMIALNSGVNIAPFLILVHTRNYGAAFSFLDIAGGWQRWLLVAMPIIICIAVINWLTKLRGQPWLAAALALVIGGALGNLYGRLLYGYVVDFLYFHIGHYAWPAFNVADSAVCVGAAIILWHLFFNKDALKS